MSSIRVDYDILNQKQTPAFYASSLATQPAFGFPGRIFIDTDTPSSGIYRDTGSAWVQVADPGAGTTGTLQQVTTNGNTTTLGVTIQGININDGAGTGLGNTAIGSSNLSVNTTGQYNTAIGFNSLISNISGINNTAVGVSTLTGNTTGRYNTAIGNGALTSNTNAEYNTAIGFTSLTLNTTGNNNTAIGSTSLSANTTGTGNTAIGYNSGSAITTGGNNTILGNYVGTPTLASNIVLSDGAGNVRLFSDANGLIGINQSVGSVPGGQLDIHSTQTYALVLNGLSTSNAYTAFSNASVGKWRIGNTYNAGANSFDIFNLTSSANALSITSANNIGINTSSPSSFANFTNFTIKSGSAGANLDLFSSTNVRIANFVLNGSTTTYIGSVTDIPFDITQNDTTRIRLAPTTGNVLIGSTTDDTANKLQVTGSIKSDSFFQTNDGTRNVYLNPGANFGNGALPSIQVVSNHALQFATNNNLRLTISASGDATYTSLAGTGSRAVLADANGTLSAPVSDISVKENINTIGYGLNEILKMNPVWFNYNNEYKNYGEGRQNGNIAQEMETIIPEAVFTTPSTGKMGINYDQLHAVYIKAIQELKAEIDALKNN